MHFFNLMHGWRTVSREENPVTVSAEDVMITDRVCWMVQFFLAAISALLGYWSLVPPLVIFGTIILIMDIRFRER